jgi:hypothetical protein
VYYRRKTIFEYIKFLLLWRKRKDVFEGDITSLQEKIEEMKAKRIEYFKGVSKAREIVRNDLYIEHAIAEGQKDQEFPSFYPKEIRHLEKDPNDWGDEEREIENKELIQPNLTYMHYLQHKNYKEFNNPEVYDLNEADGDFKRLREHKIKQLENFKLTGDAKYDEKHIKDLKDEIKKLDRKTGLESIDVL